MNKEELFGKIKKIGANDKILLLTHTDMDGATKIVMDQMFDNVTVRHCPNGIMSYLIKKAVLEEADDYDTIVATDISLNEKDAAYVNMQPGSSKLVLLDHHATASYLNQYDWAVVEPFLVAGSFRVPYFAGKEGGHSSGTSLLYDLLDYQGHTDRVSHPERLRSYVHNVALYDTWDWNDLFDKAPYPKELSQVEEMYGLDMFERLKSEAIKRGDPIVDICDRELLNEHQKEIDKYVNFASMHFETGNAVIDGKEYSFVLSTSGDYLNAIFDKMKEEFGNTDLYIVNYGSGLSFRTVNPDINVGVITMLYGGGGHQGAGGVKVSKEVQIGMIEKALEATITIDKNENGYFKTPENIIQKPVHPEDYANMSYKNALKSESDDRKMNALVANVTRGMVTGNLKTEDGYESIAIVFTSNVSAKILEAMKEIEPGLDRYIICTEIGTISYLHGNYNDALYSKFTEEQILEAMSETMGNANFKLDEEELTR